MILSTQFIRSKKEDNAFIVTLDNPPVNALNLEMLQELADAMQKATEDKEVRGIVITGAGAIAFSAGADLMLVGNLRP